MSERYHGAFLLNEELLSIVKRNIWWYRFNDMGSAGRVYFIGLIRSFGRRLRYFDSFI